MNETNNGIQCFYIEQMFKYYTAWVTCWMHKPFIFFISTQLLKTFKLNTASGNRKNLIFFNYEFVWAQCHNILVHWNYIDFVGGLMSPGIKSNIPMYVQKQYTIFYFNQNRWAFASNGLRKSTGSSWISTPKILIRNNITKQFTILFTKSQNTLFVFPFVRLVWLHLYKYYNIVVLWIAQSFNHYTRNNIRITSNMYEYVHVWSFFQYHCNTQFNNFN